MVRKSWWSVYLSTHPASSATFADDETVTSNSSFDHFQRHTYHRLKHRPCVMSNAISITTYLVKNAQNAFIEQSSMILLEIARDLLERQKCCNISGTTSTTKSKSMATR
jgi:hypothetical protein